MKQQQDEEAPGSLAREGQEEKGSRGPCMCQMSRELKLVEFVEVVPASQPKGSIRAVCANTISDERLCLVVRRPLLALCDGLKEHGHARLLLSSPPPISTSPPPAYALRVLYASAVGLMMSESPGSVTLSTDTRKYLPHAVPRSVLEPLYAIVSVLLSIA